MAVKKLAVSLAEAGEALGCSRTTVWRKVRRGEIPAFAGVRGLQIRWKDLEAYVDRLADEATAERAMIRKQLRAVR